LTKNEHVKPRIIDKLEALLRRKPLNYLYDDEIREQLRNYRSGFKGEKSLDYFYRYLPTDDLYYLHGIRILHNRYYFQLDTLIITPRFLLILESKNIAGHLYFDDKYKQLIRTLNDKKEAFDNPIEQVKRQAYHLQEIIKQLKFPFIPIESLVVMTNPRAYIECSPTYKEALNKVIKSPLLSAKYNELSNKYTKEIVSLKEIKKLMKQLNKLHTPEDSDICIQFQIKKEHLQKGVFCPDCESVFLERRPRSWYCLNCKNHYQKAHISALTDYALLISDTITNKEFKDFLNLQSSSQAYHLLNAVGLPYSGSTRSRKYHLASLLTKE
jgi:hypothetical protein